MVDRLQQIENSWIDFEQFVKERENQRREVIEFARSEGNSWAWISYKPKEKSERKIFHSKINYKKTTTMIPVARYRSAIPEITPGVNYNIKLGNSKHNSIT